MTEVNRDLYVITTSFVVKSNSPILCVHHDKDGDWNFLGKETNLREKDSLFIPFGEILDKDESILKIMNIPIGHKAERKSLEEVWTVHIG